MHVMLFSFLLFELYLLKFKEKHYLYNSYSIYMQGRQLCRLQLHSYAQLSPLLDSLHCGSHAIGNVER